MLYSNQKAKRKTAPLPHGFGEPRGEMSSWSPATERCRWSGGALSLHHPRQQWDLARPCGTGSASCCSYSLPCGVSSPAGSWTLPSSYINESEGGRLWEQTGSPHSHFPPLVSSTEFWAKCLLSYKSVLCFPMHGASGPSGELLAPHLESMRWCESAPHSDQKAISCAKGVGAALPLRWSATRQWEWVIHTCPGAIARAHTSACSTCYTSTGSLPSR